MERHIDWWSPAIPQPVVTLYGHAAAVEQVLKADLDAAGAVGVLVAYNLLYAAPFALLIALRRLGGSDAGRLLAGINAWVDKVAGVLLPFLIIALGVALAADAAAWFWRGAPLFPT